MTPDEAKAQVIDLYQESTTAVGADGWSEDGQWTDCTSHGEKPHATWSLFAQRQGALPAAPEAIAAQVQQAWAAKGHRTKVVSDENLKPARFVVSDPPYLTGSNPDGSLFQFTVGENYSDFKATSVCVAGDSYTLQTGSKL